MTSSSHKITRRRAADLILLEAGEMTFSTHKMRDSGRKNKLDLQYSNRYLCID